MAPLADDTPPQVPGSPSTRNVGDSFRAQDERPIVVFCDFDGTMTTEDMIVAVWRRFGPPGWERTVEAILARRISVRNGVAGMFAAIPSSEAPAIVEHVRSVVRFRPGLQEFMESCKSEGMEFVVASGGVDFFVEPVLEEFKSLIGRVYTIPADLSGPTIRLRQPYPCPDCGLCKAAVMDEYPGAYRVLIGDGVTDLHGAMHADAVFARGQLKALLTEKGRAFTPFADFFDIQRELDSLRSHPDESARKDLGLGRHIPPENALEPSQ